MGQQNNHITEQNNYIIDHNNTIAYQPNIESSNIENDNNKYIFWIDDNVNDKKKEEEIIHYIFEDDRELSFRAYTDVNKAINKIINTRAFNFKKITIIVSGKLFQSFYFVFKKNIKDIRNAPTVIIFLKKKKEFIENMKIQELYYDNELLNPELIFDQDYQIKFYFSNILNNGKEKVEQTEKEELTFEIIENYKELIFPTYYPFLMEDSNKFEINSLNYYIKTHFDKQENENLQKLINQLYENMNISKEIICKYWLRLYTMKTNFYSEINSLLRQNKGNIYFPFIKLCYEGLKKDYIKPGIDGNLYRASYISLGELKRIRKISAKKDNEKFSKMIVYSRCFLSFSKEKKTAENFLNELEDKSSFSLEKVIYFIEKPNFKIDKNTLSNADLAEISAHPEETEVLIFPFSCFGVDEIKSDNPKYIQIKLIYLGKYEESIKEIAGIQIFKEIPKTHFCELMVNFGFIDYNFKLSWIIKEIKDIKLSNVCFLLDNNEDFVCFTNKIIKIFSIGMNIKKEKQIIEAHEDEILCVIKLGDNRICSSSKDKTIKVIKLRENNEKYEIIDNIVLEENYAKNIFQLYNKDIIAFQINNYISFYNIEKKQYEKKTIEKKESLVFMKELENGQSICIFKGNENYLMSFRNENNEVTNIELEKNIAHKNIILLWNYILFSFNNRIDLINYLDMKKVTSFYLDLNFTLTNILKISSNKIILGLYNEKTNESIIKELSVKLEDKELKFECIGKGIGKGKNETILKINESKILLNVKDDLLIILEKKYEMTDIYIPNYIEENLSNKQDNDLNEEKEDENLEKEEKDNKDMNTINIHNENNNNSFIKSINSVDDINNMSNISNINCERNNNEINDINNKNNISNMYNNLDEIKGRLSKIENDIRDTIGKMLSLQKRKIGLNNEQEKKEITNEIQYLSHKIDDMKEEKSRLNKRKNALMNSQNKIYPFMSYRETNYNKDQISYNKNKEEKNINNKEKKTEESEIKKTKAFA